MSYVLIGVTIVLSVFALRFWLRFFERRLKPLKTPVELADLTMQDASMAGAIVGVAGILLPRPARAVWNLLVLAMCVLFLGLPHHLAIWNFWRSREIDPWLYVHYAWTLVYWLALLALPALIIARHRKSRAERLELDSRR